MATLQLPVLIITVTQADTQAACRLHTNIIRRHLAGFPLGFHYINIGDLPVSMRL